VPHLDSKRFALLPTFEPPLSEFHAALADEQGTRRVVQALNAIPESDALSEGILDKAFRKNWPDLKAELKSIPRRIEDTRSGPPRDACGEVSDMALNNRLLSGTSTAAGAFNGWQSRWRAQPAQLRRT
jgi:hypothetical protein